MYAVTETGRDEVVSWFTSPVPAPSRPATSWRSSSRSPSASPASTWATVIQQQRHATMAALQDYTRLKRRPSGPGSEELAWSLVLDSLVFTAEAEIRWLDHCEARLRRAAAEALDGRAESRPPARSDTEPFETEVTR